MDFKKYLNLHELILSTPSLKENTMYIPTNIHEYIEQCGCYMCRHAFVMHNYDCSPKYFCTLDAPPRPKCCSVAMNEKCKGDEYDTWYGWTKRRAVKPWGICRKFGAADDWYEED